MSHQEKDISDKNLSSEQSQEFSIINDPKRPKQERIALVRSMTDRLQLTLDDIRNSERPNALSIVPPDLLPLEINLAGGHSVTLIETNPVVTCYNGELTNLKGNIIHVYLRNEGEELPEDFLPHKKMITVTAQTLDAVIPSIIRDLVIPNEKPIPGPSKEKATTSNVKMEDSMPHTSKKTELDSNNKEELIKINDGSSKISSEMAVTSELVTKVPCIKNIDDIEPSASTIEQNESTLPKEEEISDKEDEETTFEDSCEKLNTSSKEMFFKQSEPIQGNLTSRFSPKIQVIGLLDTSVIRDSESEEWLHNITEDIDNKDGFKKSDTATIMVHEELCNPSDFRSDVLKTPPPNPEKLTVDVRKSSRIRKPKIRSPFKTWDDVKVRLPKHNRKGRISKSTEMRNETLKIKNVVKKLHQQNKNIDSID